MNSDSTIPATLRLTVGQRYELRLRSLGTSGYVWTARSDRECVQITHARGRSEAGAAVGASSDEIVVLVGMSAGTATVELEQRRPWARAGAAAGSAAIEVTVVVG